MVYTLPSFDEIVGILFIGPQSMAELEEKNQQLEQFNKLFVDRELSMAELKERIEALERELAEKGGIKSEK
ncbi:MAG: hypothetical protein MUO68_08050 [Desulfobacteraceae bacterium]|nr:hypothetical protein [Desulfobacteraceae bacterium]